MPCFSLSRARCPSTWAQSCWALPKESFGVVHALSLWWILCLRPPGGWVDPACWCMWPSTGAWPPPPCHMLSQQKLVSCQKVNHSRRILVCRDACGFMWFHVVPCLCSYCSACKACKALPLQYQYNSGGCTTLWQNTACDRSLLGLWGSCSPQALAGQRYCGRSL